MGLMHMSGDAAARSMAVDFSLDAHYNRAIHSPAVLRIAPHLMLAGARSLAGELLAVGRPDTLSPR